MARHRLYFALQPDPPVAKAAARLAEALRRRHGLQGRPTPAERLHVSLNWLGDPDDQTVARARTAVSHIEHPPFRVALNRVASFAGRNGQRPAVLLGEEGVIGVELLHAAIHQALAEAGLVPRRDPAFEPHMTLVWDAQAIPDGFVEPVSWTVDAFVLIDSPVGEGRYAVVGRWPLAQP